MSQTYRNTGQAMTEFIIAVTTVFLPLFIVMPLMGKWINLGFSADMAGRYSTWERTVWFAPTTIPGDTNPVEVADRTNEQMQGLATQRIFYSRKDGLPISSDAKTSGSGIALQPVLKTRAGAPLFEFSEVSDSQRHEETPDNISIGTVQFGFGAYDVLRTLNSVVDTLLTPFDWLGITDGEFGRINHTFDGYYVSGLDIPLATGNLTGFECWILGAKGDGNGSCRGSSFTNPISIATTGGIIADGWNAQSEAHFRDRTDDFVLSTMLDNDVTETIGKILSYKILGLSLEPTIGDLLDGSDGDGLGWVGTEPVPAEQPECENGLCLYEE